MKSEYYAACAKMVGTDDFVIVSGNDCTVVAGKARRLSRGLRRAGVRKAHL